jgi:hypothetical protein
MGTLAEVDFVPLCILSDIYIFYEMRECLKALFLCCSMGQKRRRPLRSLSLKLFFSPEGKLWNLLNQKPLRSLFL